MTNQLMKRIILTAEKIADRETMASYMKDALELPDYFGCNLDALSDLLSEVNAEMVFEVEESELERMPEGGYASRCMQVIGRAAEENPHVHLYLTSGF